ncbi:MAG: hypothetical protein U0794_19530 [Isosphaeraceae bacterium]
MNPFRTNDSAPALRRAALLACMVLAGAFGSQPARGAVVTTAEADDHGRSCKCGSHCRKDACCCGPRKATTEKTAALPGGSVVSPHSTAATFTTCACLGVPLSGDNGLPSTSPFFSLARLATLLAPISPVPPALHGWLRLPTSSCRSLWLAAPIDEPPEPRSA